VTPLERLEQQLTDEGVKVDWFKHPGVRGVYAQRGPREYIAVSPNLPESERYAVLAHEAGHHYRGLTGHSGRDEERADRWAVDNTISAQDIIDATIAGCESYADLAERQQVNEAFVRTAIRVLYRKHGHVICIGRYELHLLPIWVKDTETGRIWPEE